MAIEPIGSIMTAQVAAQPVAKPVNVNPKPVYTDVSAQESVNPDPTIHIVESAQSKGELANMLGGDDGAKQPSNEQIKKAVEQFNKKVGHSEAVFGIHEGTNRVTIKIIDKDTHEVIKELPPEKTLDMIARVWEMAGILVDEKR